jgi:hypothetical protein
VLSHQGRLVVDVHDRRPLLSDVRQRLGRQDALAAERIGALDLAGLDGRLVEFEGALPEITGAFSVCFEPVAIVDRAHDFVQLGIVVDSAGDDRR